MNNNGFSVRPATLNDVDQIVTIHEAGWRAGYSHLFEPELLERAIAKHCHRWASVLAGRTHPNEDILLLENDDELVGFAHFGPADLEVPRKEIHSFYIHPDHWGTGAASFLMQQVIGVLDAAGTDAVYLTTYAGVNRARRFYARVGFKETGTTSIYNLLGEVEVPEVEYVYDLPKESKVPSS
jgi:GNAT superfamily N-acetyltransferase